jgi:hypothetical protein
MKYSIAALLLLNSLAVGILALSVCASVARADNLYGSIRGTVKDPSGAAIAGAKVVVTNTGTGISKDTTTANDGSYNFLQLAAPAPYAVSVEETGFRKYQAKNIPLNVDQTYVLDIQLELGAVTQTITVKALQTQVEATSGELGTLINDTTMVNMPLNGRNWTDLMQLEPGVVAASDAHGGQGHGNFATNGSEPDQNSYLLNGTDNNDLLFNQVQVNPSPDAIAEFKMVTGTFNAEYGRNSGAILNAVIKSGTNNFHGDGFDFYRDTALNARNFFRTTPAVFHRHQFGGTIGGPIKRDRAFIFFSYQGTRQARPEVSSDCGCGNPGATPVFTSAQRGGFFSDVATSTGVSAIPLTGEGGTVFPAGTAYSTIFPTGHIPASDFDSISSTLMKFVPMPTVGNLFEFNPVFKQGDDQWLGRFDANITSKDAFWFYGLGERAHDRQDLPYTGATVPGFPQLDREHWQQYIADWNHTFNGNTLNEARIGYTRFNFKNVFPANPTDPSSVGFAINPQQLGVGLPVVSIAGLFSLGFTANGPQPRLDQTYDFTDNFSKVVGKHALKFGFDMRRFQVYNPNQNLIDGSFTFAGSGPFSTGDPGADFVLGLPDHYVQTSGDILNERAQEYYSYAQDQWKVRTNLTLTYGLGWSIDTPMVDNYHGNHAGVAFRPGQQSVVFPTAPAGYVFQGDPGVHAFGTTKFKHFAPRLGFAYSPNWGKLGGGPGKTSIRGGFGLYYNRFNGETAFYTVGAPPFALTSYGIADAGIAGTSPVFAAPFTGYAGGGNIVSIPNKFPYAPSATPNWGVLEPLTISVYDPNISIPYAENYSLTVQRQFGGSSILSLGYVGSVGHRLLIADELNPGINPAGCAANPVCVANRATQPVAFPGNYKYPGNIFSSIGEISTVGNSSYNAFEATWDQRLSNGLQFLAAYTYSHALDDGSGFENSSFNGGGYGGFGNTRSIDPFNRRLRDYGSSIYDARQRFVISYVYQIPSVRHFSAMKWLPSRVAEGWQISGIATYQTGFPLDVVDSSIPSLTDSTLQFYCTFTVVTSFGCWDVPNVVGPLKYENPKTNPTHLWFDPTAFGHAAFGSQGNAGRNILRGPGIKNWDFALMKQTSFTESIKLELRIEFFNIFNTTQFDPSGITTDINGGPTFGAETKARDPRIIQLAAKLYF